MPKRLFRPGYLFLVCLCALIAWDLYSNQTTTFFISTADSDIQQEEALQVEGLPLLRPGTLTLGEGNPTVAVAASIDESLSEPAPLDAILSFPQVDAVVRRALDMDQSNGSLRNIIAADDWVLLKVNIVTNRGNTRSAYYNNDFEHPGQITDLRVVKSVIQYLIDHVGPRRISIAEGGAESPRRGEPGFPTNAEDDGWSSTYPEFDDLSYIQIVEDFRDNSAGTQVDTLDLNYTSFRREPVPGGPIQRLGVTRLDYAGAQFGFHIEGTGNFPEEGFFMPEPILDADKIISIPAMKTTIYGTTLAIKNYVGTLASVAYGDGTSKREHYRNNPEHGYLDLFAYHPADYAIIEGFWGTEGDGPQWGLNVQHNVVVAGSDPVATEAVANVTMGFNPLDLEHLYLAAAKGYGTLDLNKIDVVGRAPQTVQHNFVKSRGGGRNGFFYGRGIRRWLIAGPFEGDATADEQLPNEADLQPTSGQAAGDATWTQVEHLGYSAEVLPLGQLNGTGSRQANYAFAQVYSERAQEGFLWAGYGDRAKIWLNGAVIFENPARANFNLAGEKIPISLEKGTNRLLFKIGNFLGDTMLAAHIVDEDGDRLPGIQFLLPGEMPVSTAVEQDPATGLPQNPALRGNYPNPFNPHTQIRFELAQSEAVRLEIYNTLGQQVRTLVNSEIQPGSHQITWDSRDKAGFNVASGIYYAVLSTPTFKATHPMVLLR